MRYTGSEHFITSGKETGMTMADFWRWSHPDFLDGYRLSVLSKFIVSSSLGLSDFHSQSIGGARRPCDILTGDGYRIRIESASYLQSCDGEHPCHISFPVQTWDADAYVFCLYKATSASQNPLDLDLWEFFSVPAAAMPDGRLAAITLPRLMELGVWQSDYYGIADAARNALDA